MTLSTAYLLPGALALPWLAALALFAMPNAYCTCAALSGFTFHANAVA